MCSKWVAENGLMEHGGARLKDFCAHFGIDSQTYYRWLENADFADAIKKGKNEFKEKLEQRLVESLSKAACGYEFEETKTEYEGKKVKKKIVTVKNVEANVGAAIFLLTNISPDRWRNKQTGTDVKTEGVTLKVEVLKEESVSNIKKLSTLSQKRKIKGEGETEGSGQWKRPMFLTGY